MMSKITLNQTELNKVYNFFSEMNESAEYGSVTLERTNECEIGSVLTATMYVTHRGVEGDFTVTITDEVNW